MPKINFDEDSLVYIATYFNKKMVSVAPLRNRQDSKFLKKIRKKAIEKLGGPLKICNDKLFYFGCVDFMVTEENGNRKFVILETNGGSSRGILSLAPGDIESIFTAYKNAIDKSAKDEERKVVIIGTVPNDYLFQEKIMLAEFLKERYEIEGYSVGIYNSFNFETKNIPRHDIIFIIANYNNLLDFLSYKNDHITFKGQQVDVVIGDGIARRFQIISAYIKHDWTRVKTLVVNPIYHITDDKGNTYLAINEGYERLKPYKIQKLKFAKAFDPFHLEHIIEELIKNSEKNYILKPFGGSGGVGIQPISPKFSEERGLEIMERSISEFYQKFDARRSPFPYTIQEMADFALTDFNNSRRTFDIRIYVVQKDGCFYPLGGEGRVARLPYSGTLKKEEFVVNLSGFDGIDIDRAIAFNEEGLNTLGINEEDLSDMFCAACILFDIITENHNNLVKFSDWDSFLSDIITILHNEDQEKQ
ncbi:MAG: hypothetical protein GF364_19040 [Candidatus Lokiarchaeota archaeon]|nr:hypothetical protein [Candidatus Lokiarchaeota archaeon]